MSDTSYAGGEGPPLVLLHGLTASWRIWQPVLPALAERHAVFAPNLAGHAGMPALEPADGGVPALADALERRLDEQGIARAHLVGNSLGGWLALELARRGRAESCVALSPAGAWAGPRQLKRVIRLFTLLDGQMERRRDLVVALLRRPGLRKLALGLTMEHAERIPAGAAVEIVDDAIATTVVADLLAWVRTAAPFAGPIAAGVPVRVAWAEHDRVLPFAGYGRPYRDILPAAEHLTLSGCGHVPMYDDPGQVVRTILEVTQP